MIIQKRFLRLQNLLTMFIYLMIYKLRPKSYITTPSINNELE